MQSSDQQKIRVVIRKRPLNKKQIAKNQQDVVQVHNAAQVKVREHKLKVDLTKYIEEHMFKFDSAFGQTINNEELYQECVKPIISCAFLGAKVTCFAYGQTGSGKTYTMNGDLQNGCPGIYHLGASQIFSLRDQLHPHLSISVSFFEIYCGKLFDLLNNRELLQARQDGKQNVNIVGLTVKPIQNSQQFIDAIIYGSSVRITSQNGTNSDSSRSHAILQISLMNGKKVNGKISFIDLAGCQRGADTIDQNKQTKIDGAEINKSLLALKQCIRALDQAKNHTPFRGSKLTMVLKDSFTGFCRTVMIGNVSPGSGSCQNTLNTLRYADRVKQLKKGSSANMGLELTKQQQLTKQLMLPRTLKNRQIIIKNESDSQQQIVINPLQQKNIKYIHQKKQNPRNAVSTAPTKKMKYLHQKSIEEQQQNISGKKKMGYSAVSSSVVNKVRKGIMGNNQANMGNQNNRSINAGDNGKVGRNKSVAAYGKLELHGLKNVKGKHRDAQVTDRTGFQQNHSAVNLLGERDSNTYENMRKNKCRQQNIKRDSPYFVIDKVNNMNKFGEKTHCLTIKSEEYQQTQEQKYIEGIINKLKCWLPNLQQSDKVSQLFGELARIIINKQSQISGLHRDLLLSQETVLSQSLQLHSLLHSASNKNNEMLGYTSRMSTLLQSRMGAYGKLRDRIQKYQYYLGEYSKCEANLTQALQDTQQEQMKSMMVNSNNQYAVSSNYLQADVPLWME